MSIETDFRALLAGHVGLTALVGTRIATNAVPQDSAVPLVVFTGTHQPEFGLSNVVHGEQVTFSVQCWGDTSAAAEAVATQVKAAVATDADYLVVGEATAFDDTLDLHAVELSVDIWIV